MSLLDITLSAVVLALVATHLVLTIKVILPLAKPKVDLAATLENLAGLVEDTIQQEIRRQDDRIQKRIERTPPDNDRPTPSAGVKGQPYRR